MVDRLKTVWLTFAAVALLLFGSLVLDKGAMVLVVLFLLAAPVDRIRGGTSAVVAGLAALALAAVIRVTSR